MAVIIVFRAEMIGRLTAAYAGNVDDTTRSIVALDSFGDAALAVIGDAYLTEKTRVISGQQDAIPELATPVLSVRSELLILPLIGMIDSDRARAGDRGAPGRDRAHPGEGGRDRHHPRARRRLHGREPSDPDGGRPSIELGTPSPEPEPA
jgi:hypothetical protein